MATDRPQRRIALYGGSFNPPHLGHVQIVSYVLATENVSSVWIVPVGSHAFAKKLMPFEHRKAMCELALRDFAPGRACVSDVEQRLGGVSRTIDTVKWLMEREPDTRFDLVLGTDIFGEKESWKAFDELERLCGFIVIGRTGYPDPADHPASPPLFDVSSTAIRAALQGGQPTTHLLPREVRAYIEEHGLYRHGENA